MRACLLSVLLLASLSVSEKSLAFQFGSGPNLLTNPSFENGLENWTVDDQNKVDWIVDYGFPPPNDHGLGAAVLFADGQISQCVFVFSDTLYTTAIWAFGGCADSSTLVRIDWYADGSCSTLAASDFTTIASESDTWKLTSRLIQSTSNAQSAQFQVVRTGACKEAIILDNAEFSDQIFGSTFEE